VPITLRGRHYALAWVAVFLALAAIVSQRDRRGFRTAERIDSLARAFQVVSRQHAELQTEINTRLAPGELSRVGAALGLRVPTDSEIEQVGVPRH
jgi:hypothetical protein